MGPQSVQSYVDQAEGKARIRELIGEADRPAEPAPFFENRAERRARQRAARRARA